MTETGLERTIRLALEEAPYRARPRVAGIRLPVALSMFLVLVVGSLILLPRSPDRPGVGAPGRTGAEPMVVQPSGSIIAVRDGVLLVLHADGSVRRELARGAALRLQDVSNDGRRVLTTDGSRLNMVDIASGNTTVLHEVERSTLFGTVRWSADQRWVYAIQASESAASEGHSAIMRVATQPQSSSQPLDVTPRTPAQFFDLLVLPDGRLLTTNQMRTTGEGITAWVSDPDGRNARPLLSDPRPDRQCLRPSLSPDGSRVALSCSSGGFSRGELVVIHLASGVIQQHSAAGWLSAVWSADGSALLGTDAPDIDKCNRRVHRFDIVSGANTLLHEDLTGTLRVLAAPGDGTTALIQSSKCEGGNSIPPRMLRWVSKESVRPVGDVVQALWVR